MPVQCGATTTHVYSTRDKLGIGASCDVFTGVQKNTGATHALKIFKSEIWSNSFEHQREVEALKKLKHPNIVAFYGREKEMNTGRTVLVMEYCQGGSLHRFLQEPENMHGLGDKEFLIFLTNTCAGLKHLRINGFVHRDIKPGNILRSVNFDGTVTYKISDFGSSKNVESEDGEFMSLAGTEEYLHPAMYVKAFVNRNLSSTFNNTVDLWSLGCTIFHACTGDIPFKPHGGVRHNRNSMYIMITCKPSGSISGSQRMESKDIQWQYELPEHCQIAKSLRNHVEKIIAGLVEGEKRKQWTFETFELEVQKIASLKKVCVVNIDNVSMHNIYSSSSASFAEFYKSVSLARETSTDSSPYLLFHKNKQLSQHTDFSLESIVNDDNPVFLIGKGDRGHILPYQTDPYPSFTPSMTLEQDVKTAVKDCRAVNQYRLQIKTSELVQQGLTKAKWAIHADLKDRYVKTLRTHKELLTTAQEKRSHLEMIGEWEGYRKAISHSIDMKLSSKYKASKQHCLKIHQMLYRVQDGINRINTDNWFSDENTNTNSNTSEKERNISSRAEHLFEESKSKWRSMKTRLENKPISEFEEEMHKKDKKDIQEICAYTVHLWQDICHPKTQILYNQFSLHNKKYLQRCAALENIEGLLNAVKKDLSEFTSQLSQTWAFSGKAWTDLCGELSTATQSVPNHSGILICEHNEIKVKFNSMLNELPELDIIEME